jgi:hypothetical protein
MNAKITAMGPKNDSAVLMFSGGRDSTIASIRLHEEGYGQTLVTVTSDHLNGINLVRRRLIELRQLLPPTTKWLQLRQPKTLPGTQHFNPRTCLPCHHAYVTLAGRVLRQTEATALAFGYAQYQNSWPEQTPMAIESLTRVLSRHGVTLLLPAYSVASKSEALQLLTSYGVSTEALEQKCVKQVFNITLPEDQLRKEVQQWESAIGASLEDQTLQSLEVIEQTTLGDL